MFQGKLTTGSLVLYKVRPARVCAVEEKIEIELEGGKAKKVRDKDIELLHPGPLASLDQLATLDADLTEAWELLAGESTNLGELSELIFGDFTPVTAWSTWQYVADGLYFEGRPGDIQARPLEQVRQEQAAREAKISAAKAWSDFVRRLKLARPNDADCKRLGEVEQVALGTAVHSRILKEFSVAETQAQAHRFLVKVGYWTASHNPYPCRLGVSTQTPALAVPELLEEDRLDLTQLEAYAIDDEGNQDPDDAISLDGDRIWVHVADVASLVTPDSLLEQESRSHGSNLYLPEGMINMLPAEVTERLGLGLQAVSPALSFGFRLSEQAVPEDIEIRPSLVRVTRLAYQGVEQVLGQTPFNQLLELSGRYRRRRKEAGAAAIQLPEVSLKVRDGQVTVRPIEPLRSRDLVTDAMLMAGEAAAIYCQEQGLTVPFASQAAPDNPASPATLSEMFAYRRRFRPTQVSIELEPHSGLGLSRYCRATSPLRRYSDLLVHQQIRRHLLGQPTLDAETVSQRISVAEQGALAIRRAERLSNTHWKLVYLRDNPDWCGRGVVVAKNDKQVTVVIPELALDAKVRVRGPYQLDQEINLTLRAVELPDLTCYFHVKE